MNKRQSNGAPRDISYAHTIDGVLPRATVRAMENATGRIALIRRAAGYQEDLAQGADFWALMAARYGLVPEFGGAGLAAIPPTGPLVVVANHPFGVLDGLMMGLILSQTRGRKFRILANEVFSRAPELAEIILPIDFSGTPDAARRNIETRRAAQDFLASGGAVGIFPGGTVSTRAGRRQAVMDPAWRRFTAKMVSRSRAQVVPVFFEGQNSGLFQFVSQFSVPLRMGLLIHEFRARVDQPVRAMIGAPIGPEKLAEFGRDPKSMMDFLREQTYGLSPTPVDWRVTGLEFDERHKAEAHGSRRI